VKLKHENYERITVISLQGDLTTDELEPLRRLVADRLLTQTRDFVLDLSQSDFVDSRGLETLLWLQEQADSHLGQVRLAGPTENVRKILHITRLENHFDIHDDLDSALKSLR
jgi:anti-sigma B factor antagonist